jgi:branched-chain amino acid transport system ATP-binding protein
MGLAPMIVEEIFRIIKSINETGTTILLVEQNAYMSLHIATKGYVLETGKIVLSGTAKQLLEDKQVGKAYLGALT